MRIRSIAAVLVGIASLLARCGDSAPTWIPRGYLWEAFETWDGQRLAIAWPAPTGGVGSRPLALLVHGGGWTGGRPDEMEPVARMIVEFGYQPVIVQYRRLGEVPNLADSVSDLRSAWKHVVDRAEFIGGTTEDAIVIGGSAGGHLALWAFGTDADAVRRPKSLLLLCPVLDTSPETGFGADRLGGEWRRWSARHAPMKTSVPVLIAHGSDDEVVSLASTMAAVDAMVAAGSEVRLAVLDGVPHGFYVHDAHLQAARGPIEGLSRLEASP